ncbi:MAG: prepilin-type N-terminal cleavage/methylation domain-containing protein [Verrucomicrobiales bacterium]|jgi:prepilin-type N-terminal cleavage/methylation domain-containing protein
MNFHLPSTWRRKQSGFSLIELLVVIAVIGIITAIGIARFQGVTESTDTVVARRNAQTIATIATSAQAAGDKIVAAATNIDEAVAIIIAGTAEGIGNFADMKFQVADLSPDEVERAKVFLDFTDGTIVYNPRLD